MNPTNRMAGANGTTLIKTTALTGRNFEAIYVRENSVVSVLQGTDNKGAAIDYLSASNTRGIVGFVATEALKAGELITCPEGYNITTITLTSGSALGY